MKKLLIITIILFLTAYPLLANSQENRDELIQIALLLDTSNSMDGLINQAKSQLWKIVNEFALARKNGKIPQLQIALYEYGNNSIPQKDGYIRQVVGLTRDLDKISDELFRLQTNGGDEYCGEVIKKASEDLKWSTKKDILKIIFIAGNEPFTQGSHSYQRSCKEAVAKGIIINTIFCGDRNEGISTSWKDGADIADGAYSNIDQNQQIAYISAPQDDEINRLGAELNKTYVAYGSSGKKYKEMQKAQDANAASVAQEVMVQRSAAKASAQYSNEQWDLVDAVKQDSSIVSKLEKEQLPEEKQSMKNDERIKYISDKNKSRTEIQSKINKLNNDRKKYVEDQQKKDSKDNTLDQAMLGAIRKQAQKRNYSFE
jgi:hypothetical protein